LANDIDTDPGTTLTMVIVSQPEHGTLYPNTNGTFTYSPHYRFSGIDQFIYRASDGMSQSNYTTVTIVVNNHAPEAIDDTFELSEDASSFSGNVRDNDSDPDQDSLTVSLLDDALNGTLTLYESGTFYYTPDSNFFGEDSFTYRLFDGLSESFATVTLNVTAVNDAPVLTATTFDAHMGTAYHGTLLTQAGDEDSETLTFEVLSQPQYGTFSLQSDGDFVYTPNASFRGYDYFSATVSDGVASASSTTFTIFVGNHTPQPANPTFRVYSSQALSISVGGGLVSLSHDADDDSLAASVDSGPVHGTLQLQADGSFVYTPNATYSGTDSFTYTLSDGFDSATGTVSLVVDPIPLIAQGNSYTVLHDRQLEVQVKNGLKFNDWHALGQPFTVHIHTPVDYGTLDTKDRPPSSMSCRMEPSRALQQKSRST
jgi:VCBS repeat-containing protein